MTTQPQPDPLVAYMDGVINDSVWESAPEELAEYIREHFLAADIAAAEARGEARGRVLGRQEQIAELRGPAGYERYETWARTRVVATALEHWALDQIADFLESTGGPQ